MKAATEDASDNTSLSSSDRQRSAASRPDVAYAIDIVKLNKSFKRFSKSRSDYTTIKSALLGIFRARKKMAAELTFAIQNLTMRIPQGASMGIIGKNGSGKSTLLKLITGIYKPTSGSIAVNGRMAALIELGAGFHPDFTGRENLYLGGVMHGLSRAQIDDRFEDIVQFAELKHVIDDPVRTYSSGMFMRLGFSLAVHTDPDILLIDEVLAVGDAAFVSKCKERVAYLRKSGKTLLLVTHDLDAVERWCDEALWLNKGKVMDRGHPRRVIDAYRQFVEKGEAEELKAIQEKGLLATAVKEKDVILNSSDNEPAHALQSSEKALEAGKSSKSLKPESLKTERWGSREIEITSVDLLGNDNNAKLLFHPEDSLTIEIKYLIHEEVEPPVFGIGINRSDGVAILGTNTDIEKIKLPVLNKEGTLRYKIERLGLLEGNYLLDVAVHREDGYPYDYYKQALQFAVRWSINQVGVILPRHYWELDTGSEVVRLKTTES